MTSKEIIARRAALFFKSGDVVNLGIGIPGLCAAYSPEGVFFQSENGYLGIGKPSEGIERVESYCSASGIRFVPIKGAAAFDSAVSFSMIRCGRVDATVLGGLQVAENGNLANWATPGRAFGMGGAMDLVSGAKKVIVAMELCTKDGKAKIVNECSFPLTGVKCVDHIVTEYGVFDVTKEGIVLTEIAPEHTPEEIQSLVEPKLIVSDELKLMYEEELA